MENILIVENKEEIPLIQPINYDRLPTEDTLLLQIMKRRH